MTSSSATAPYFPYDIQISYPHWRSHGLGALALQIRQHRIPRIQFFRQLALKLNGSHPAGAAIVHAGELNLYASLLNALRLRNRCRCLFKRRDAAADTPFNRAESIRWVIRCWQPYTAL